MRISCICPTFKRPEYLRNAIACFEWQDHEDRELIVLDDADQFFQQGGDRWILRSQKERIASLPEKFNEIISMTTGDIICVWEDDDIYLPWHLSSIAEAADGKHGYFAPTEIHSTYAQPFGGYQTEKATGRFHSSWAFTRDLILRVGGYPSTGRLDFDQQLRDILIRADGRTDYLPEKGPSVVYRWGNGIYHGSQTGEDGYKKFWGELDSMVAPWIGKMDPVLDQETRIIHAKIKAVHEHGVK